MALIVAPFSALCVANGVAFARLRQSRSDVTDRRIFGILGLIVGKKCNNIVKVQLMLEFFKIMIPNICTL